MRNNNGRMNNRLRAVGSGGGWETRRRGTRWRAEDIVVITVLHHVVINVFLKIPNEKSESTLSHTGSGTENQNKKKKKKRAL